MLPMGPVAKEIRRLLLEVTEYITCSRVNYFLIFSLFFVLLMFSYLSLSNYFAKSSRTIVLIYSSSYMF